MSKQTILDVARAAICSIGSFDRSLQDHYQKQLDAAVADVDAIASRLLAEAKAESNQPEAVPAFTAGELQALINYHDYNEAGADAADYAESAEYHGERSKLYSAMLERLKPQNEKHG